MPIVDPTMRAPDLSTEAGQVQRLVCPWTESLSAGHFLLDIIEGLLVNDGLVCSLDIILGQLAAVLLALLCDRVGDIFLLKQQVAGIGFSVSLAALYSRSFCVSVSTSAAAC